MQPNIKRFHFSGGRSSSDQISILRKGGKGRFVKGLQNKDYIIWKPFNKFFCCIELHCRVRVGRFIPFIGNRGQQRGHLVQELKLQVFL